MSAVCTICNKRRAKRPCHATSTEICVLCCAEAREITLDCPRECSFLQEARKHESLVKLTPADVPHRDIVVSEDFVRDQEWVVLWLGNALTRAMERTKAVDANAREALDAIVKRQRGIESRAEDPISAELAEALETAIEEEEEELEDLLAVKSRMIGTGFIGGKSVGMLIAARIAQALTHVSGMGVFAVCYLAFVATLFGYTMWAGMHGIVMLHQSGMLSHGPDYQALAYFLGLTMLKGAGARMAAAPAKRTAGRQKK